MHEAGLVYAASLTPLSDTLDIDHARLVDHVRRLFDHGCDGVALMGTTGEANSFSVQEREDALEAILDAGVSPDRLMVGTGCCAIPDTVRLTNHALECGVSDVLMLPPFYYKGISDEGLFATLNEVMERIDSGSCHLYLYHFPYMSAVPYSDRLIGRLLETFPVKGIKDSSGDFAHMARMVRLYPSLKVFAGTERYLLDVLQAGGVGCITATVNVTSRLAARVAKNWRSGQARKLQDELTHIRAAIEQFPMIAALKFIMERKSADSAWRNMRPPNVPLSSADAERLEGALVSCAI